MLAVEVARRDTTLPNWSRKGLTGCQMITAVIAFGVAGYGFFANMAVEISSRAIAPVLIYSALEMLVCQLVFVLVDIIVSPSAPLYWLIQDVNGLTLNVFVGFCFFKSS
jgi:hypothetical protein